MKTSAQSLIAALLLSTATIVSTAATLPAPSGNPTAITSSYKVAVFPSSLTPTKINVIVEHQVGKAMDISLRDANGTVLATQHVGKKAGNVRFKFDLANLTDGDYQVEVNCGTDRTVHPVTLATESPVKPIRLITMN